MTAPKTICYLTATTKKVASKDKALDSDFARVCKIVATVDYPEHSWIVKPMGDGFYVQLWYIEPDVDTGDMSEQYGRKWYVSRHATKSEIVQTMLLAALTSAEHRVREHFKYSGERVFMPHFSVDDLHRIASSGSTDVRKTKGKK